MRTEHSPAAGVTGIPKLEQLGSDLLTTTARQRRRSLARPFMGVALYALVAALGWWWATPTTPRGTRPT